MQFSVLPETKHFKGQSFLFNPPACDNLSVFFVLMTGRYIVQYGYVDVIKLKVYIESAKKDDIQEIE